MGEVEGAKAFQTPARVYDRFIGRYGPELARAVIEAAGVHAGDRVLDVGCGPGALTTELVAVVGADRVVAVDPSEPFAQACAQRLPGVDVRVAAAESLPFESLAFDRSVCQLVVNFMTDAPLGVGEMQRVTRDGGTVAAAVWDYGAGMTLLRAFWDAAIAVDPAVADRDEAVRMPYATEAALGDLWLTVGLTEVRVTGVEVSAGYDDFDDLWLPLEGGAGPAGAYTVALPPEARTALRTELRGRLGVADAPFRLTAGAWIAVGRVVH